MLRKWVVLYLVFALSAVIAGCGSGAASGDQPQGDGSAKDQPGKVVENTDPVTLTLFVNNVITDDDMQRQLLDPLKKKYPYITVTPIVNKDGSRINDLLTAGTPPDLFNIYVGAVGVLQQADLLEDITPLAKKDNIDLSRFQPVVMDSIKAAAGNGALFGLPRLMNTVGLFYNKDIFDKFGVAYPTDGMTWDQTIELAKKVSRSDSGINYLGFASDALNRPGFSLSLAPVDGKTNKATLSSADWRRVMELNRAIYSIPGNIPDPPGSVNGGGLNQFNKNQNLAMLGTVGNQMNQIKAASANGLNWDVAQYPSFPDKMNIGGMVDVHIIGISKTSKHKDAAIKVVEIMTSDESQLSLARDSSQASPLTNPEMVKQFGTGDPFLKGKNIQALFKSKPAPSPQFSIYTNDVNKVLVPFYVDYVLGNKDLNTTIREAEDAINKKVEELSK
jgi:multiple sugar transport system substrate-binding protein